MPVYNYITGDEAEIIAERIYKGKSRLCSSYAWDTALKFIDGETGTYAVYSTGGNYYGNGGLRNTGYHVAKNIYDMGGNVLEWTSEHSSHVSMTYVSRGGLYTFSVSDTPAALRNCDFGSNSIDYVGVRCTLYM